jgi:peptide-methionine (R)-S-oxide reductase
MRVGFAKIRNFNHVSYLLSITNDITLIYCTTLDLAIKSGRMMNRRAIRLSSWLLLVLLPASAALLLPTPYHCGSIRKGAGIRVAQKDAIGQKALTSRRRRFALGQSSSDNGTRNNWTTDLQRRTFWKKAGIQALSATLGGMLLLAVTRPVWAATGRSRSDGYEVQKSEAEWKSQLSPMQYFILREGGTERPGFSILEKEKRPGLYTCAGCTTPLFSSDDKFNSGTGWPSFARGLKGVEEETEGNALLAASLLVSGVELRCRTCGGHLGDVFRDGFLFVGTPAAKTGNRYCIDGAALLFYPNLDSSTSGSVNIDEASRLLALRGDVSAKASAPPLPAFLDSPKIVPRERD